MKTLYQITQAKQSLGIRTFAETKAFTLKCCWPSMRPAVVRAKRLSTLQKAVSRWADITVVAKG